MCDPYKAFAEQNAVNTWAPDACEAEVARVRLDVEDCVRAPQGVADQQCAKPTNILANSPKRFDSLDPSDPDPNARAPRILQTFLFACARPRLARRTGNVSIYVSDCRLARLIVPRPREGATRRTCHRRLVHSSERLFDTGRLSSPCS